jgi:hypothetical protein
MFDKPKFTSNPFSSSGAGIVFEHHVQTCFSILLLADGFLPGLPNHKIKRIELQAKRIRYATDDLVAITQDLNNQEEVKMLVQVKHDAPVIDGDGVFSKVISGAWKDFKNPKVFKQNKDKLVLVTGPMSKTDIEDVRTILNWARHSKDWNDFYNNKISLPNYSSDSKRNKLKVFRNQIKKANDGVEPSNDDVFSFLRHFYIYGYDLDIEEQTAYSFLTTIINQFPSSQPVTSIYAEIFQHISDGNQSSETITKTSFPQHIQDIFQRDSKLSIPNEFLPKPVIHIIDKNKEALFIALILGGWNESYEGDGEIAHRLGVEYANWIREIQNLHSIDPSIFSLRNGSWKVQDKFGLFANFETHFYDSHIEKILSIDIDILSEINSNLEDDEVYWTRFLSAKNSKYSSELRKGIVETLVYLGIHKNKLRNCSLGKVENAVYTTIFSILQKSDWKMVASLNELLPLISEANPRAFLDGLDYLLKNKIEIFKELYSRESSSGLFSVNHLTGLYRALEGLAWSEEYLPRVILILARLANVDPGGNWANRPINSIQEILIPWRRQTTASLETKKGAILGILPKLPSIVWKILTNLLPWYHQSSHGIHRPTHRVFIPLNWDEKVTQQEYGLQIAEYSKMILDFVGNHKSYVPELVDVLDNMQGDGLKDAINFLANEGFLDLPEEKIGKIYEKILTLTTTHRNFSDADWAFSVDIIEELEKISQKFIPKDPFIRNQYLFSNEYTIGERNRNSEDISKELDSMRKIAIQEVFDNGGLESVLRFASEVDQKYYVGYFLGIIASIKEDNILLPKSLQDETDDNKEFLPNYINARYRSRGENWIDELNVKKWSKDDISIFLNFLPLEEKTWQMAEQFLRKDENLYWAKIQRVGFSLVSNWEPIILKLLKFNRPFLAIDAIYTDFTQTKKINKDYIIPALLSGLQSSQTSERITYYYVAELISELQNLPDVDEDILFKIEWGYLRILDKNYRAHPKILFKYLQEKPEFFIEMIQLIYRSNKESSEDTNQSTANQQLISQAWRLLHLWKTPPGLKTDGTFHSDELKNWFQNVVSQTEESGNLNEALSEVGKVLYYSPEDPSGLWIHKSVCEILENTENDRIRSGFTNEVYNSRGVYSVDPTGAPEKQLANIWKIRSEQVQKLGYVQFSESLKRLAEIYEREAERNSKEERED